MIKKSSTNTKYNIDSNTDNIGTISTNNVLTNCNICMTGLSTAELHKAINIIRELGGSYSDNLSKSASCLIGIIIIITPSSSL